jgi:hypothetical protein
MDLASHQPPSNGFQLNASTGKLADANAGVS